MSRKIPRISKLSKKISQKTGLGIYEIDGILKVTAHDIIEILRTEQRFYWDGLGIFKIDIKDKGLAVVLLLSQEAKDRLNKKEGERSDEIIFD